MRREPATEARELGDAEAVILRLLRTAGIYPAINGAPLTLKQMEQALTERLASQTPSGEGERRYTLEEIDAALYDAHRAWDAKNMRSLSDLMVERLRSHPTEEDDG